MSHGRRLGDSSHDATDASINDTFNHVNPAHNQTRYQSMNDSPKPSMGAPIQPYSDTNGQSTTPPLIPALHGSSRGSSRTSPLINPQFNQTMRMNHSPMSQSASINASINQSPLVGRRQSIRSVGSSRIMGHRVDENSGDYVSPQSVNSHLYTPKPSPGMRTQYGQSPAPNPAMNQSINQSISANYSELPALDATHRYVMVGTLQQSLFGIVKLAYDRLINQLVAIKISRLNRAINQTTRSGVSVLENVRREAAIMQYLAETSARKRWLKLLNQQSVNQAVDSLNQSKPLMNPLTGRRSLYADMFVGVSLSDLLPDPSLNSSLSPDNNLLTHQIAARRHTLSSRAINRKLPANNQMMDDDEDASHVSPLNAHLMNNQSIASTAKNSPYDSPAMTTSLPLLHPTPMTDQPVINLLNSHVALENGNASMYQAINQPSAAPMQRNSAEVEQKENPPPSDGEQVIDYFYSSSMGAVPIPTHINPTLNQAINEALIELTAQLYDDEPVTSGIPHSHHPLELRWRARMTQRSASPNSQQSIQQSILDDLEGESYICGYHSSFEDSSYHYLLIDFIPGGDLYSMLTSFPCHRLSESCARWVFRQMVCGVLYLHVRGVAHLDMSLENMCLDAFDDVRVIDFGVAAVHPHATTAYLHSGAAASTWSQATPPPPDSNININSHTKQPLTPHPPRSFMCRAVSDMSAKPGKIRYMSPELFQGAPWDAFANDVFSLGVILYSLLTGRPPFQQAYDSDLWFKVIYTGTWLTPQIRSQPSAHVFTHLSDDALDLINCIIKPQSQRPTCEQILQHRFMLRED